MITRYEALTAAAAMQDRSAIQSLNGEDLVERVPQVCLLRTEWQTLRTDREPLVQLIELIDYPRGIPLSTAVSR